MTAWYGIKNIFKKLFKFFIVLAFFPIFAFINIFKPSEIFNKSKKDGLISLIKEFRKKLIINIALSFIKSLVVGSLLLIWFVGYSLIAIIGTEILRYNPRGISIAGTGSMYPTFPKSKESDRIKQSKDVIGLYDFMPYPNGLVIFSKRYFGYNLNRGDIVVAENEKIKTATKKLYGESSGVVKRIIALPGDYLEIRGGLVYLNNKPLIEPYTAKPHSTFGEEFLEECKKITIPYNKLFIMGDNRKGSGDSREFGLVDFNDIKFVISFQNQKEKLDDNYRDVSRDLNDSTKIKLNKEQYLELLNKKRKKAGIKVIKYQPLLEKSAFIRGNAILKYNDFSFEATKSGTTMEQSMNNVGYSNVVWGEAPTQGYYEAGELIDNQFEYPKSKEFLLNKDFQEIGLAEIEGVINGCPTQVIVQHFAGYIPPNYKKEEIEGWKNNLSGLKEVRSGWVNLKENKKFYEKRKQEVDRINEIIEIRITNIEAIVNKMESNKWLSKQETDYTYKDGDLYKEQQQIATRLNNE